MGRPRKPASYKTPLTAIFGENVLERLPRSFPLRKTRTDQLEALAARTGIAVETLRRTVTGKTIPGLDVIEKVAAALRCHADELLRPIETGTDAASGEAHEEQARSTLHPVGHSAHPAHRKITP